MLKDSVTWWRQPSTRHYMRLHNFFPLFSSFYSIYCYLLADTMCPVRARLIPRSKIAPRWLISSLALEGVCSKPSGLWTIAYTLTLSSSFSPSPFFLSLSLTHTPPTLKTAKRTKKAEPCDTCWEKKLRACRCIPSDKTWQRLSQ